MPFVYYHKHPSPVTSTNQAKKNQATKYTHSCQLCITRMISQLIRVDIEKDIQFKRVSLKVSMLFAFKLKSQN